MITANLSLDENEGQFPLPPPPDDLIISSSLEDFPPPPPSPPASPPTAPLKTNYLITVTPKPYKSPSSSALLTTPTPFSPAPSQSTATSPAPSPAPSSAAALVSSPTPFLARPSQYTKIADFALNAHPESKTETETPPPSWLVNNSAGTSPVSSVSPDSPDSPVSPLSPATPATPGSSPKTGSQWSISPQHAERRALGLVPDSLTENFPPVPSIMEKDCPAQKVERKLSAPTVTFGGTSSGTSSSKSIAKLILGEKKTSLPSRKTSKEESTEDCEGLGRKLSDIENKVVPLTFRRTSSSSSESQDSDNNAEIPARKEVNQTMVETREKLRSSPAPSPALGGKTNKNEEEKYETVRAVPYREQPERKFSTGNSATSSKSIAKMILSQKKNSLDEGRKYEEMVKPFDSFDGLRKSEAFSKPCNGNERKYSVDAGRKPGEANKSSDYKKDSFDGVRQSEEFRKPSDDKDYPSNVGRKHEEFNPKLSNDKKVSFENGNGKVPPENLDDNKRDKPPLDSSKGKV